MFDKSDNSSGMRNACSLENVQLNVPLSGAKIYPRITLHNVLFF